MPQPSITKICLKITYLKFHSNELKKSVHKLYIHYPHSAWWKILFWFSPFDGINVGWSWLNTFLLISWMAVYWHIEAWIYICFMKWLTAYSVSSHCLNHSWLIVNWNHGNQFGSEIFLCLKQNAFQNAIRRMLTILFRPQCVKTSIVIAHWIAYGSITYGGQGFNCLFFPKHNSLTHLPVDKMAAISQMIVSDAFSWMKSFVFWLKFHWSLFLRV